MSPKLRQIYLAAAEYVENKIDVSKDRYLHVHVILKISYILTGTNGGRNDRWTSELVPARPELGPVCDRVPRGEGVWGLDG